MGDGVVEGGYLVLDVSWPHFLWENYVRVYFKRFIAWAKEGLRTWSLGFMWPSSISDEGLCWKRDESNDVVLR